MRGTGGSFTKQALLVHVQENNIGLACRREWRNRNGWTFFVFGGFDPSHNKHSLFLLRKTNKGNVSFRLEDGAAIRNGGIEKAQPHQAPGDSKVGDGFDPSTPLRMTRAFVSC
jgi:hypothetical protein